VTRILVAALGERGHTHPLLGPFEELQRRGHEPVWWAPEPDASLGGAALAQVLRDPSRLARWIRALLVDDPARDIAHMRALIRASGATAVAVDTMYYAVVIAAHLEGVPWVGLATSLNPVVDEAATDSTLIRTIRALDGDRRALFAAHGMPDARFRVSDVLSPWGTACFATEALVGPCADPSVHLVGPSLGGTYQRAEGATRVDPSFARGRPIIYASFGSQAWHQPERFADLVRVTQRHGYALVAAMGELARTWPASEHVRVYDYVDQLALLPRVQALVTHGGANSVMEACAHGVPMLVAPLCNDQPHNAAYVVRAGIGRAGAFDDLPFVLGIDGSKIEASYAARDGSVGAAELVERALP